jgi:endonuclease/exonuclease/phosphatase family metal-dependent hydrolase
VKRRASGGREIDVVGADGFDRAVPYYADLNPLTTRLGRDWAADEPARKRVATRLLALRKALREDVGAPPPRSLETLVLGTWNLREFDSETWGKRIPETYAYIAEVIDRFDMVALQEVRSDLRALDELRSRLGRHWQYLVSDVTEGRAGNQERLAFLYDTAKVRFLGIAGELVLPPVAAGGAEVPAQQVARTPLMAAFQVGWTKFVLATVHILYGADDAEPIGRIEEIRQVARFLRDRTDDPTERIRNFIVLGDFNIFSDTDKTMLALTQDGGFTVPEGVKSIPGTNVSIDKKKYDQIAFRSRGARFESTGRAGAFDYYGHVFTDEDADVYRPYIDRYIADRAAEGFKSPKAPATPATARTQYRTWRTYQMSDHLPLWAEFRVEFSDDYLAEIASAAPPPPPQAP